MCYFGKETCCLGCHEEFIKRTFPDLLSWQDANLTFNKEYVKEIFIPREIFCQQSSKLFF